MSGRLVRLVGGPADGRIEVLRGDGGDIVYVAIPEPIDITTLRDASRNYIVNIRRGAYRARRIARTGHIVHDPAQHMLFDYIGER